MHRNYRETWRDVGESATVNSGDSSLSYGSSVSSFSKYSTEFGRTNGSSIISDLSWLTDARSNEGFVSLTPTRWREGGCLIEKMPHCPVRRSSLLVTECSTRALSPRRKAPSKPERRRSLVCCNEEQSGKQLCSTGKGPPGGITKEGSVRWNDEEFPSQELPTLPVRRSSVVATSGVEDSRPPNSVPRVDKDQDRWSENEEAPLQPEPVVQSTAIRTSTSDVLHQLIGRNSSTSGRNLPRATSFSSLGLDEFVPQEDLRPTFLCKQQSGGGLAPVLRAMQMSLEPVDDCFPTGYRAEQISEDKQLVRYPSSIDLCHSFSASTIISKLSNDSAISSSRPHLLSLVATECCAPDYLGSSSHSFEASKGRKPHQRHWAPTA